MHTGESLDNILSIDNPKFISIEESNWADDAIMYVYRYNEETRVYPQVVLDGHELVNDVIGDHYFSITYCPLTGSGICWNRKVNNKVTEFGVSGILYNENLVPYDRATESFWSQMRMQSIFGQMIGHIPEQMLLLETKFSTIKSMFPNAWVLTRDSLSIENLSNPQSIYKDGNDLIDPDEEITQLPSGNLYYGIISGAKLLALDYEVFNDSISIIQTVFNNENYVIVGSKNLSFIIAFRSNVGHSNLIFEPVNNSNQVIMVDNFGNSYDIFGNIVSDPNEGSKLIHAKAYVAKGFAWNLFFNQIITFEEE